jgi:peptidyl-prolyl cis-trans isomerase C
VLKVGAREVTLGEFKQLLGPPPMRRVRETEAQRRRSYLSELERTELLFVRAQRLGYADSAASESLRKQQMVQLFVEDELAASAPPPTDTELREAYAASDAQFRGVEQVRARHVLLRDRATARALLARILADASPPLAFERAAREQSLDKASAAIGGDLGYLTLEPPAADVITSASGWPRPVPNPVRRAAFALTHPLEIAREPVTSTLGQHLIMLVARYPARRAELEQVSSMLRDRISAERRKAAQEKLIEELTARSHVQRHDARLKLVGSVPATGGAETP